MKKDESTPNHLSAADLLGSLLHTEQLTVKTYQKIADKSKRQMVSEILWHIRGDHEQAVQVLKEIVESLGGSYDHHWEKEDGVSVLAESVGTPSEDPFAWKALKEREEENIQNFELALNRSDLNADVKKVITDKLLPMTKRHVPILDRLLNAA